MVTLQSLFEKDKASFLNTLKAQPDTASMIKAADSALSRILFAYNEQEESERVKAAAYSILTSVRTSLNLIDSFGETKVYSRQEYRKKEKSAGHSPLFWVLLGVGAACCAGAVILLLFSMRAASIVINLPVFLVLLAAGMICLFISGMNFHTQGKQKSAEIQTETTADADKIYKHVFGILLTVDHLLADVRTEEMIDARHELEKDKDGMNQKELALLAQLLEDAYTDKNSDLAMETISHIKYYLHNRRIEAVDYSREDSAWFDILPGEGGTLRPALVMDNALLKKGLAAGGRL